MAQKVIEIVGVSKDSLAKAAENAVAEAAKSVRGMKWARAGSYTLAFWLANPLAMVATALLFTRLRLNVPRGFNPLWTDDVNEFSVGVALLSLVAAWAGA